MFFCAEITFKKLAISHRPRIIVYAHLIAYLLSHYLRQRLFPEIEPAIAISRFGIHPPGHIHIDIQYLGLLHIQRIHKLFNARAQSVKPGNSVLECIRNACPAFHKFPVKINDTDIQ